ncbi:MAG: urease accessory protein UreD [Spirulinaceae cyanobacterium]
MPAIVTNDLQPPQLIPSVPSSEGWQGELALRYDHAQGQTRLQRSHHRSPLKVQRPFYPEGPAVCHTVMLHTAGGIVGGDRLQIQLDLQPQAQVLLTTAAASKLYRSDGPLAQQQVTATLAPQARLEWFPQESIAFRGARYQGQMRVELAAGATFTGWEITRFGRTARGERFDAGDWRSQLEVWQEGSLQWSDRQWLPGNKSVIESPHGLGGTAIGGTLVWLGEPITPSQVAAIRELPRPTMGETGITTTQGEGLLCRYRGSSTSEARGWFMQVWQYLRQQQWGRDPVRLRIWG